eukprot:scaffold3579_cov168-Cylindrotheca_fusiformis.AAC.3
MVRSQDLFKRKGNIIVPSLSSENSVDGLPSSPPQPAREDYKKQGRSEMLFFFLKTATAFRETLLLLGGVIGIVFFIGWDISKVLYPGVPKAAGRRERVVGRDIFSNTTSFCLLTKDDNEILNEWIAYHYHVLNMRQLIVAVDPVSKTSPVALLQKWRHLFGMDIEIWNDEDYMPDGFLQGDYDHKREYVREFEIPGGMDNTTEEYQRQLTIINKHRKRQHIFVSHCLWSIKQRLKNPKEGNWVAHIDSDEYISVNPKIKEQPHRVVNEAGLPGVASEGSLLTFVNRVFRISPAKKLRRRCLLMPRILYIPQTTYNKESNKKNNDIDSQNWNTDRFETLRWKVHRDLSEPTGLQKAMMDVAAIPEHHDVFQGGKIFNVHSPLEPSRFDCPELTFEPDLNGVNRYPLVVNHYIGSLERYLSRNDARRHESIWRKKEQLNGTLSDGWISTWLPDFVKEHGLAKVSQVLGEYRHLQ